MNGDVASLLLEVGEPEHVGHALAHNVEQLHGEALPTSELFDQPDALLQRGALLFELVDFTNDGLQPQLLLLRMCDVGVNLCRPLLERPVPVTDAPRGDDENQAACERQPLADVECDRLLLGLTFAAEQVDANHRSLIFRRARPTATAADGAMSAGSPPSFLASHATARNGSKSSTGVLKRSCTI